LGATNQRLRKALMEELQHAQRVKTERVS